MTKGTKVQHPLGNGVRSLLISSVLLIAKALGAFASTLIGLLASSTKTSDANEASENAACGGVLNYRTGRFDDGTDAAGWYEKD